MRGSRRGGRRVGSCVNFRVAIHGPPKNNAFFPIREIVFDVGSLMYFLLISDSSVSPASRRCSSNASSAHFRALSKSQNAQQMSTAISAIPAVCTTIFSNLHVAMIWRARAIVMGGLLSPSTPTASIACFNPSRRVSLSLIWAGEEEQTWQEQTKRCVLR